MDRLVFDFSDVNVNWMKFSASDRIANYISQTDVNMIHHHLKTFYISLYQLSLKKSIHDHEE